MKIGYSGIIPFMCVGTVKIHKYMQYEVPVHMGRIENQSKEQGGGRDEAPGLLL